MSIVSEAEIITRLGLGDTATEADVARVTMLHRLVEAAIKEAVGYSIEQATHIEFLPATDTGGYGAHYEMERIGDRIVSFGSGIPTLQLSELPVRSITSIYEDPGAYGGQASGAFGSSTLLTAGSDYYLDIDRAGICRSGIVRRMGGSWSNVPRSIKVTYVAGYSTSELDGLASALPVNAEHFKLAVLEAIKDNYEAFDASSAIKSESLKDYSVTYGDASDRIVLSRRVRALLPVNYGKKLLG